MAFRVKPNVKKIFIIDFFKIIIVITAIIGFVLYLKWMNLLEVYVTSFKYLNLQLFLKWIIIALVIFVLAWLIIDVLRWGVIQYTFYYDRLLYPELLFLFIIKKIEIPYMYITRLHYKEGVANTGTINIEVTGMNIKEAKLRFIDNVATVANELQRLIDSYKAAGYTPEERRISEILNQY